MCSPVSGQSRATPIKRLAAPKWDSNAEWDGKPLPDRDGHTVLLLAAVACGAIVVHKMVAVPVQRAALNSQGCAERWNSSYLALRRARIV